MPFVEEFSRLCSLVAGERQKGKKIVTTNGCFDILHLGHVRYLAEAAKQGDVLVVGVNSDASVKKIKGKHRPVNSERDRAEVLAALRVVDYTFIFGEPDPRAFLRELKPDVHVKGGDYTLDRVIEREIVEGAGGRIALVGLVAGHSTTAMLKRISETGK